MTVLSRKLLRDIGLQKTQFIAVAVTVFLGITMFGASYDSFQNLQASYDAMDRAYVRIFDRCRPPTTRLPLRPGSPT